LLLLLWQAMLSFCAHDVVWQVCALLTGGGYAEKVVVPAGQLLPVPEGVSLTDAASLPEVACTVWSTVFMTSHLSPGESFLVSNPPFLIFVLNGLISNGIEIHWDSYVNLLH
jgi:hypothetical protein